MNAIRITRDDPRYPGSLFHLQVPPAQLWLEGDLTLLARPIVAVVGSRQPSPYGMRCAFAAAKGLAEGGAVIVSGMAHGLDAQAHQGALAATSGTTIAVLGGGIDVVYPRSHRELFEGVRRRGLLVSEYEPGTRPWKHHFPWRNRIIAALAKALLVVEGKIRGGTSNTVEWMLRIGRPVLAVPGHIDSELAEGPNLLLRDGAHPYLEPADLLWRIGLSDPPASRADRIAAAARRTRTATALREARHLGEVHRRALTGAEATLYDLLRVEPVHVDQLAERSHLPPGLLLAALSSLELQGLAVQLPGKQFALAS
jgi:DNA processing protein